MVGSCPARILQCTCKQAKHRGKELYNHRLVDDCKAVFKAATGPRISTTSAQRS